MATTATSPTLTGAHAAPPAPRAFYPLLVGVFPVLAMYSVNTDEAAIADVAPVVGAVLAISAGLVWVLRWIYPTRPRAAMAAALLLVLTFTFSYLHAAAEWLSGEVVIPVRARYLLVGWGLLGLLALALRAGGKLDRRKTTAVGVALYLGLTVIVLLRLPFLWAWLLIVLGGLEGLRRASFDDPRTTRLLNTASLLLIVTLLLTAASIQSQIALEAEDLADESRHDWADRLILTPSQPPRDIYFLVFDRYASSDVLREHYGHDNAPFCRQLAERGFFVPSDSRANYPKTVMSLAAAMNMEYLEGSFVQTNLEYGQQLANHRIGRLLKQQGYAYYYFGNWAKPRDALADVNHRVSILPSEFAQVVYDTTPLAVALPHSAKTSRVRVVEQIEALKQSASAPGPKFVFAHFLLPHPPFQFDRHGNRPNRTLSHDEQYLEQLLFTNGRIIEMVDAVLAQSKTEPIIVVQADEGPRLSRDDAGKPQVARMDKRTGILSALHLPGVNARRVVPPTLSPVNTFRVVLREYFGADLKLMDDRVYYWDASTLYGTPDRDEPCQLVDVTERLRQQLR